jgi:hypothetical protein
MPSDDKTLAQFRRTGWYAVKISRASGERKQWLEMGQRTQLALQQGAAGRSEVAGQAARISDTPDLNRTRFDISHTMAKRRRPLRGMKTSTCDQPVPLITLPILPRRRLRGDAPSRRAATGSLPKMVNGGGHLA